MEQTRELDSAEKILENPKVICNIVVPTKLITKVFLDTDRLEKAVYKFIKSQPNLSAGLRKEGERLFFSPLKAIKDYFVALPSDEDWREICIEYSNNHIRKDLESYPPIKVLFVQPSANEAHLILTYRHYAMDGTNGISATSDILDIYSKLKADPDFEPVQHKPSPSFDKLRKSLLSESQTKEIQENFKNYHLNLYDSINCTIPVHDETTRTLFMPYSTTESVYNGFKTECKRRGFTLSVALCAANTFAFAACIFSRQQDLPDELYIHVLVPMNMRERVASLKDLPWKCGNFSVVDPHIAVPVRKDSTFWELASFIKEKFTYILSNESKFYMFDCIPLDKYLTTAEEKERFASGKKRLGNLKRHLCFSNMRWYLGDIDHEEFTVDAVLCTGGPWLQEHSVFESFVYTTRKLHFTMLYRDEARNEDSAKEVMHYIQYLVENAPIFSDKDIALDEALTNFPYQKALL